MHVLLVDDDEATLFLVERMLQARDGLKVTTATGAEEGMRVLQAQRVDVVLTDYRMPGPNGADLLRHARAVQPHARRVLMSGTLDQDILRLDGAENGIDFLFEKPDTRQGWSQRLAAALAAAPQEA